MSKEKSPTKIFGITLGKAKTSPNASVVTAEERENVSYVPTLPIINVIPAGVVEKYQIKGILRKFSLGAVAIVAVFGLTSLGVLGYISTQQAKIDDLTEKQATLTAESAALQPYQAYNLSIDGKRQALKEVTAKDINMGTIYENINTASTNSTITISTLSVAQNKEGEDTSACVNPDPFASTTVTVEIIGCVTLEGSADSKDQVNGFLAELESIGGDTQAYINPFVSTFSTAADPGEDARASSFSATIAFTNTLYTNKYSTLALSLAELIASTQATDSASADATDTTENIEDVALPPAGIAATFAKTLIADISDADARSIDGIAYTSCSTGDSDMAESSISSLIESVYPDVEATTVVPQIMAEINDNCDAIIAAEEDNQ